VTRPSRAQLEATVASLVAEVQAMRLRLANRTAQVDLLLAQIDETKQALAYAGLEITYTHHEQDNQDFRHADPRQAAG
jgi:hypothetical protein